MRTWKAYVIALITLITGVAGTAHSIARAVEVPEAVVRQFSGSKGAAPAVGEAAGQLPQQQPEEGAKLLLKAEPADGQIVLTWASTAAPKSPEETPSNYVIHYGTEPNAYGNKVDAGLAATFRIQNLTNERPYFVRVMGYNADRKLVLSSEEARVIPMSPDASASSLERAFARQSPTLLDKLEPTPLNRSLRQFGYEFFKNSLASLAVTENLPVGPDYVVGPGDSIRIDVWGSFTARYEPTVDRNGEILIPRIGPVKLWGLTYGQAREAIDKALARYYKGYELNVTLGSLRTIQVYVVGEVETPGVYSVSSLATVVNALAAAGGPSKNGSLRSIRVSRPGAEPRAIDLYDMFLTGDRSNDVRLQNGDTVFVPVIGPVVAVAGEVRRPGIYELKGATPLARLVAMAGGITAAGDTGRIQLERIEGNSARVVLDYEPQGGDLEAELARVDLKDRDMVTVFPVFDAVRKVVTLTGNVTRPGAYQLKEGMRVRDILPDPSALLPESYLESAEITRLALPEYRREVVTFNLRAAMQGDPKENLPLQEQDTVRVFSRAEMLEKHTVSISGAVLNPGSYEYFPRMTVRDLVTVAGSPKRNAFLGSAELTRINVTGDGARASRQDINLEKAMAGDPDHNLPLQTDDVLIVRSIENWLEASDRFVTLRGEVKFPGTYSIAKGERLSSVIARAGGYTEHSCLKGAKFTRRSVREEQQRRMDEVIARTEQDVYRKQAELSSVATSREELEATKAALDGLLRSLAKLKTTRAEGRVVIRLAQVEALAHSSYDLELEGGDELYVPPTPSVVSVMGSVYNPTSFLHISERDVAYYLERSGGATRDAELDDLYIIKADGSVFSRQQSSFGIRWDDYARRWTFGGFLSSPLEPGDTLVVPQKLERTAWMREIKDITTILSQVAITAGVIIAAGL
ncbi:SLBB domain-containing protein [Geobacter sulfurreducens]|uniref:SLBB domain-containing protein n=1 Tax=Geobacter sulfurreducens TaxID=35554 RepID=UPI001BDC3026|nr:SLBB domain-containing protein [Geobacter sulfurreducens]QVW33793.1 SLBB domain-containing protein [Geobacter sulfurreducens]